MPESRLEPEQAKISTRRRVPVAETITKDLRAFGSSELTKLRNTIFFELPPGEHNFLPPDVFLPDDKIKIIIDIRYSITDVPDIVALVGGNGGKWMEFGQFCRKLQFSSLFTE